MNNFRNLRVWKKAVQLATIVYKATEGFPRLEQYGLTSQIRKSVVSISSNIAEGAGRNTDKEFSQFLHFATGSCYELETQLTISRNLNFLDLDHYEMIKEKLIEIQKMIYSLRKSLK